MNRPVVFATAALAGAIILTGAIKLTCGGGTADRANSQVLPNPPGVISVAKEKKGVKGYIELLHAMRANQNTGTIDLEWIWAAREQAAILRENTRRGALNLEWETMGPNNIGGRTRAILIDKDNPNRMYTGGVTGGLWISNNAGQSWFPYANDDTLGAIGVASIVQAANGDIYVGTGEGQLSNQGVTNFTTGFLGEGIWKSTDGGTTFQHLPSTKPSGEHNSTSSTWIYVNAIVTHPTDPNILIAGTARQLQRSTDGGQTWSVITGINPLFCEDLKIDPDGIVYAAMGGRYYKGDINGGSFTNMNNVGGFPSGGMSRIMLAIAPSDPNYVYAITCQSNGETSGVFQSKDKGETWVQIAPDGFNPTGVQGDYDMEIAVNSENKELLYVGGQLSVHMGQFVNGGWNWYPVSNWFTSTSFDDQYVHADHHEIVLHPTNPNILYIGTDGGVFQTQVAREEYPDLPTFAQLNKGYNVTQFYSIAAGLDGSVMGGTQDNGTLYVDFSGNTTLQAKEVSGGDGGFTDISKNNVNAIFGESQFGTLRRSANRGDGMAGFFDQNIDPDQDGQPGQGTGQTPFYTAFRLWEEFGTDTLNYAYYKANADEVIQNTVSEFDNNDSLIIIGTDTFAVKDMRKTFNGEGRVAIGINGEVWLGTDALDFSQESTWYEISRGNTGFSGTASTMDWSVDGDILYVGTTNGQVFRIDGLLDGFLRYDTLGTDNFNPTLAGIKTTRIASFGRFVCEVAVDKNDPDHVVVALGNYGNSTYVYRTTTAATVGDTSGIAEFFGIQGGGATRLPPMPVYSCLIDYYDSDNIIVGTELGIYTSDNGGLSWAADYSGMPAAATFMLRQEMIDEINSGCYVVYAGTHGRGLWRSVTLTPGTCKTDLPSGTQEPEPLSQLRILPNPIKDVGYAQVTLAEAADVEVMLVDLYGRLVSHIDLGTLPSGQHTRQFSSSMLQSGTYVAVVKAGHQQFAEKIVVAR